MQCPIWGVQGFIFFLSEAEASTGWVCVIMARLLDVSNFQSGQCTDASSRCQRVHDTATWDVLTGRGVVGQAIHPNLLEGKPGFLFERHQ